MGADRGHWHRWCDTAHAAGSNVACDGQYRGQVADCVGAEHRCGTATECAAPEVIAITFPDGRESAKAELVRSTLCLMSNGRRYSRRGDNRAHSATVRTMHRPTMPMVASPGHEHARRINFWPASACIKLPRPSSFFHLTFDESEKVGVDPLRIDDCDTVSATLVDFQDRVRNDRWYAAASRTDRHYLIVFAVYDE
jgi:hypothetical protein